MWLSKHRFLPILTLLVFAVLWKGGKSLETTWLLVFVAWFCTYSYHAEHRSREATRVHPLLWSSVILFILWTGLSYLMSTTKNYGLDEVLRDGSLGLLFLWTIRACSDIRDALFERRVIPMIAYAALLACVIGVAVYIFQPVNRFVGTFFDWRFHTDYWPNAFAEFLLLSWPLLFLRLSRVNAYSFIRLFVYSFLIACLMLSYSRGAMLVFAGQVALPALFFWPCERRAFAWRETCTNALIVLLLGTGFFALINGIRGQIYEVQSVTEKVTFTAAEGGSSVSERGEFWKQAWGLAKQKPLFGWGPYSFRFVQPRFQNQVLATSDHPHNVFLKLMAERGLPAALLFLSLVIFILSHSFIRIWYLVSGISYDQIPNTKYQIPNTIFFFVGVAGVLGHNLIDYNLQFVGIALPTWILLGILASDIPVPEQKNLNNKFVRIVEVALASLFLVIAMLEARPLILSSLGRHAEATGDSVAAIKWYDRSKEAFFSRDLHLSRAKILFDEGDFDKARSAIEDSFAVNREDARAWKRLGDIALASANAEEALAAYEQAYELNRWNDLSITHGLLKSLLALKRDGMILERRAEFDALLAAFGDAIQRNAHYIALSPNVEELIAIAELLSRLFPDDAPRYQVLAARADHQAEVERGKIAARPPGFLW